MIGGEFAIGERGLRIVTGWVRIQLPDVIKTRLISILMGAKMQLLEVVTVHSQFLSRFSIPKRFQPSL